MITAFEVYPKSLDHCRCGFDPQLVLTSLPLCYFVINIPVEENLLIGLTSCIIIILCLSSPVEEAEMGNDRSTKTSLEICKAVGERHIFIFSLPSAVFAFEVCMWRLAASIPLNLMCLRTNSLHPFTEQQFKR